MWWIAVEGEVRVLAGAGSVLETCPCCKKQQRCDAVALPLPPLPRATQQLAREAEAKASTIEDELARLKKGLGS